MQSIKKHIAITLGEMAEDVEGFDFLPQDDGSVRVLETYETDTGVFNLDITINKEEIKKEQERHRESIVKAWKYYSGLQKRWTTLACL